ncbi:MAG: hypothetical protein LBD67_04765 [Candidatus Accumulibacter sp.]|nr:hypothetical protein [Accumulibacter sp.]
MSKYERTLWGVNGLSNPLALSLPKHRQRLSPFVLSLSKYERTPPLSSPYPSTSSGRTDWKGVLRTKLLRQAQDGAEQTD